MVLVFNHAGALVLLISFMAWAGTQVVSLNEFRLVAGFGMMAALSGILELQGRPAWRPRSSRRTRSFGERLPHLAVEYRKSTLLWQDPLNGGRRASAAAVVGRDGIRAARGDRGTLVLCKDPG